MKTTTELLIEALVSARLTNDKVFEAHRATSPGPLRDSTQQALHHAADLINALLTCVYKNSRQDQP